MTLILATRNRHKVEEIRAILPEGIDYRTLNDFPDAPEIVEDADTFAGNAVKKAVQLAEWLTGIVSSSEFRVPSSKVPSSEVRVLSSKVFVLADDSGLEVDALGGAPGVHSARFAAMETGAPGNSPTADNNAKLLRLLQNVPLQKRSARFRCVLALAPVPTPEPLIASPVRYA